MAMKRRDLLKVGVGATQLALLGKLGLLGSRSARAGGRDGSAPSKLLTIYVSGGWMPIYLWCPLRPDQIDAHMPQRTTNDRGAPLYFGKADVTNLDGSGDELADGYPRIRVPVLWDDAALSSGSPDPKNGFTLANGYSWKHHKLWENTCVIHGIDMATASHNGGRVGAMCGFPGDTFRSPSVHALVANGLYDQYADTRPLPSVQIEDAPYGEALTLRPEVGPVLADARGSLDYALSDRIDRAWAGLRGREDRAQKTFAGESNGSLMTTAIDEYALAETRRLRGSTNETTDAMYQRIHDGLQGVSRRLAQDVVSQLDATAGVEHIAPFWTPESRPFGTWIDMFGSDPGTTWETSFNLALKLLKADTTTSVSLLANAPFPQNGFDTHGQDDTQFVFLRALFEVLGNLLGEMKATPLPSGKTLLDDTLVVIFSEFGRSWPGRGASDHWPVQSVALVGGGVAPNRMVGDYDTDNMNSLAPLGTPLTLRDVDGKEFVRPPRSGDVIETILRVMQVDAFVPGGHGEIVGVRPG